MVTIHELARIVIDISGKHDLELVHVEGPQGVRGRNLDNSRLREVLGWEPGSRWKTASTHVPVDRGAGARRADTRPPEPGVALHRALDRRRTRGWADQRARRPSACSPTRSCPPSRRRGRRRGAFRLALRPLPHRPRATWSSGAGHRTGAALGPAASASRVCPRRSRLAAGTAAAGAPPPPRRPPPAAPPARRWADYVAVPSALRRRCARRASSCRPAHGSDRLRRRQGARSRDQLPCGRKAARCSRGPQPTAPRRSPRPRRLAGDPAAAADTLERLGRDRVPFTPRALRPGLTAGASWLVERALPGRRPARVTDAPSPGGSGALSSSPATTVAPPHGRGSRRHRRTAARAGGRVLASP